MQGADPASQYFFDEDLGIFVPVSTSTPLPSGIYQVDNDGETAPIGDPNPLHVQIASQTTRLLNVHLAREISGPLPLYADALQGDYIIQIATGSGILAGDTLFIYDGLGAEQVQVVAVANMGAYDDITIDIQLPKDFLTATPTEVFRTSQEMAVAGGTLAAPLSFRMPHSATTPTPFSLDLSFLALSIQDGTIMDDGTFGGIAALLNGCVLRHHRADGINVITNFKTNGEMKHLGPFDYDDRGAGGGVYGCDLAIFFEDHYKSVIRISDPTTEYLELLVQDDLSGLTNMRASVGGQLTT